MLDFDRTTRFKRDWKKLEKQGRDMNLIIKVMTLIIEENEEIHAYDYKLHRLSPKNQGNLECHIGGRNGDWLLIFKLYEEQNFVIFTRTGSHSELFE
jgi:mRNA interferase YafQ